MRAIAAMDPHRTIGNKGKIPWYLPEDFKWFKKKTLETKKMVMGRETFQSIGALKGRLTYVLTTDTKLLSIPPTDAIQYINLDFLKTNPSYDIWVCGGVKTYMLLLPLCTEVFMTHVIEEYDGDAYMPYFEDKFPNQEVIQETKEFWIVRYWKPYYTPKPSISPKVNQARADCLNGKCLQDNPYDEIIEYPKWAMWKTGYVEQICLMKRQNDEQPLPND